MKKAGEKKFLNMGKCCSKSKLNSATLISPGTSATGNTTSKSGKHTPGKKSEVSTSFLNPSITQSSMNDSRASLRVFDWEGMYATVPTDEELAAVCAGEKSVIMHLLSQLKFGMDLSKITLPTYLLEQRSLLEMFADFFSHPEQFLLIPDASSPLNRMLAVLKWYVCSFHAGRRSELAKKPYNPILGETFECYWPIGDKISNLSNAEDNIPGPSRIKEGVELPSSHHKNMPLEGKTVPPVLPWIKDSDYVMYYAEQVSHHPPVTAFYAEHSGKRMYVNASIYTKSKYLGMSIGVRNVGQVILTLLNPMEKYVITIPDGFGRSIFTTPWVELGGSVSISCAQTGYSVKLEFMTKSMLGNNKNRVQGSVIGPNNKEIMTLDGNWKGIFTITKPKQKSEVFADVSLIPIIQKHVRPLLHQQSWESHRLWKYVTLALRSGDLISATKEKNKIEDQQRNETVVRENRKEEWKSRRFTCIDQTWVFNDRLDVRENLPEAPIFIGSTEIEPIQISDDTDAAQPNSTANLDEDLDEKSLLSDVT